MMQKEDIGKSSLWERIKVCYYVLTKQNYVYFGLSKDPCLFDEEGNYIRLKGRGAKCYISIVDEKNYNVDMQEFFLRVCVDYLRKILTNIYKG